MIKIIDNLKKKNKKKKMKEFLSKQQVNDYLILTKGNYSQEVLEYLLDNSKISSHNLCLYNLDLDEDILDKLNKTFTNIFISQSFLKDTNSFMNLNATTTKIYKKTDKSSYHYDAPWPLIENINLNPQKITEADLELLNYLPDNAIVNFDFSEDDTTFEKALNTELEITEEDKIKLIKEGLEKIKKVKKKLRLIIKVENRHLYEDLIYNFKDNYPNIELIIFNDNNNYTYSEYMEEEKKLYEFLETIPSSYTPLEKYMIIYQKVKDLKPYKEADDLKKARQLKYILNGDTIVCVGFAVLFETLLNKVGIKAYSFSCDVLDNDEKRVGHRRVIVDLDDDKYNIHGLFMSDPTWDNSNFKEFNHSLMNIDNMQLDRTMFYVKPVKRFANEYILDIHSKEEFNDQVNFYLKRNEKEVEDTALTNSILVNYEQIITKIIKFIRIDKRASEFIDKLKNCYTEKDYTNLLDEIGSYLLTRINVPFDKNILYIAFFNTLDIDDEEKLKKLKEQLIRYNEIRDDLDFPYEITDEPHKLDEKKKH